MTLPKQRPKSIEDFEALRGVELGPSGWHGVSQAEIDNFADLTGDHQWIHVDITRAKEGPFGGTIAHGLMTLSLGPTFMEELFAFDGFQHSLNYGYDRVRFPQPRPVDSKVRMTATVTDVRRMNERSALVSLRQIFEGEGLDKPICVADALAYFTEYPRGQS